MRVSGQLTSGDAVAWIRVASPSSPHRVESMLAGTFHIGSSKSCHLRLGDDSIPDLLAVIVADRTSARISCQCSSPMLLLNGQPVEDAPLNDGDLLEAGPYSLLFRRLPNDAVAVQSEDNALTASQATSSELVDAIEQELAVVEELEHTPAQGWQGLAARLLEHDSATPEPEPRDVIPIDDVHCLLRKLEQGQQTLRLQQDAILQELAELKQLNQQKRQAVPPVEPPNVQNLEPPTDSVVVPIRPSGPLPPRRASA